MRIVFLRIQELTHLREFFAFVFVAGSGAARLKAGATLF